MSKEISSKNTKNEILSAYEDALTEIKTLNSQTKQQTLEIKKKVQLLADAEKERQQDANQLAEQNLKEQHDIIKQAGTLDVLLLANKKKQLEIDEVVQCQREQKTTIAQLNQKLNEAGGKVQEIALHAIEISSKSKQPITITSAGDKVNSAS